MRRRRRAALLVLVLLSLALAAALITPLATLGGVAALESAHSAAQLRHRLAADSVVALLPKLLSKDRRMRRDLDRTNRARFAFKLHDLEVDVLLQDDTAKLPILLLAETSAKSRMNDALAILQTQLPLPSIGWRLIDSEWRWTGCLEDLFADPTDRALYGSRSTERAWTQYVSPVGRRVHVYRAAPAVLAAALLDLDPGLGQALARKRATQTRPDLAELLASIEIDKQGLRELRRRLTARSERYSLLVRTRIGRDARQRYLICDAESPARVLVDWEVAP